MSRPAVPPAREPAGPPGSAAPVPFRDRVRLRAGVAELLAFRVGAELFALPLEAVLEVAEPEAVHRVPESSAALLGLVDLRGQMVPLYAPSAALGVAPAAAARAMLVLRDGGRRVGIAIDDVDDVLAVELAALRPPPEGEARDGVLLAVAHRGADVVGVLDPRPLVAACTADSRISETAA